MEKILLCGNGINIKFNKKFQLNEFIDILKDEEKLMDKIDFILSMPPYKEWNSFSSEFIKIVKRCKKELNNLSTDAMQNGIEVAISTFFKSVDTFMRIRGLNTVKNTYDKFKKFFRILFFNHINLMAIGQDSLMNHSKYSNGLKNKLMDYLQIYTLNYDSILENFLYYENYNDQDITHLHGKMFFENENNELNFENCLLDDEEETKSEYLPNIHLIQDEKLKNQQKLELDIIGFNPINDESILALFINSKVCKRINFYYHTNNDLKNLKIALEKIKSYWISTIKNNLRLNFQYNTRFTCDYTIKNKYILYFSDNQFYAPTISKNNQNLELNLILSSKFWEECENKITKELTNNIGALVNKK